ncbi:MAG: DUF58 domain-containing protein [Pseudomonadota bacterium]
MSSDRSVTRTASGDGDGAGDATITAAAPPPTATATPTATPTATETTGIRFDEAFLRKLEALAVVAKRTRGEQARAERRSRRVGAGIEFADHREYARGDDVRALDWNLFARLDRPYVRLREEDEDLTLTLIVDASASMAVGAAPKLELAVRIAAALAYIGLAGLERVGVSLVADGARDTLPPARGKGSVKRVLSLLDRAAGAGATNLSAAVRDVLAAGSGRRRSLTVLLSDLFDPGGWLPAVDRLRAARHEVVVVQITAAADAHLTETGDIVVEDAETGEQRELAITAAVCAAHAARHAALLRGVSGACRERGVSCFQIASEVPFEDAVLRILRAGGVVA